MVPGIKNLPAMQETQVWFLDQEDHWKRNCNPLQYSYLDNPMERGPWRATVHGVTEFWVGYHLATKQYLWNIYCCVSGTVLKALSKLTQSLKPYDAVTIVSSIFTDWDTETKMSSDLSKQTLWSELGFEPMWLRLQPLCWPTFVRMQPVFLVSALHTSFNSHSNSCKWAV